MHDVGKAALAQRIDLSAQVDGIQNVVALLVNHLALVVGHVVVFQQLFANIEIARLHLALRTLNTARHNASLNGFALGHFQAVHDGANPVASENPHQRIVQAQIKARRTRITLAARTATQLVVNAA